MKAVSIYAGLFLALASSLHAQDAEPLNLGRTQDVAARPMALGGSYTAVASDASALFYNPAGLSAVKKHEWSLSLEQSSLSSTGRAGGYPALSLDQELTRIQSLGFLLPIPTVRGGLTFAFGFYRPRTFSDLIGYSDSLAASRGPYKYESEGTLNNYRVGMGLDLAPDVSLGLAFGYVGGREDIRIADGGESGYLRAYHGFNIEPALMFKVTPRLRLGASLVAWEKLPEVEETYEEKGAAVGGKSTYDVDMPFQLKLGLAYQGDSYLLAADYKVNDWSAYRWGRDGAEALTKADYRNEHILSLGAEKFLKPLNTVLRGGYAYNTLPEQAFTPAYQLHRISAGLGFLFSGSFALDAAYTFSFWEVSDPSLYLENREQRALVSFSYRY
jgi:long-subunit fatty acid transport protein